MSVIWKSIPGHERFEASSLGEIKDSLSGNIVPTRSLKGYPGVTLNGEPRNKRLFTVHSLVAMAFIGQRPEKHQINHKDGVKTNNCPENLEYVTCKENIRHSWNELGNSRYGTDNPAAKISSEVAANIRREYIPGRPGRKKYAIHGSGAIFLADKYGISKAMVINIVNKKNWEQVDAQSEHRENKREAI